MIGTPLVGSCLISEVPGETVGSGIYNREKAYRRIGALSGPGEIDGNILIASRKERWELRPSEVARKYLRIVINF